MDSSITTAQRQRALGLKEKDLQTSDGLDQPTEHVQVCKRECTFT